MTNTEIEALISDYNQTERAQQARLQALLVEMRSRKGYREIRFTGSEVWTVNQFQLIPEHLALISIVDPLQRFIKSWKLGEP